MPPIRHLRTKVKWKLKKIYHRIRRIDVTRPYIATPSHFTIGFLSSQVDLVYGLLLLFLFLLYEFSEFYRIRDNLFPEIRQFTAGFTLGVIIRFVAGFSLQDMASHINWFSSGWWD